jgi:hypothetical protein
VFTTKETAKEIRKAKPNNTVRFLSSNNYETSGKFRTIKENVLLMFP